MKTKGAVLYETNANLVIDTLEIPKLQLGQVLVKIICSGICRSQIHEIEAHKGPDNYLPHLLGHEAVGVVEKVSSNVSKVSIGDKVVLTWIKGTGCDVSGSTYIDSEGVSINSGAITTFSNYAVLSENRLVKIPESVPDSIAPLFGCAIPTGVGIIQNELDVQEGQSIAIFGVGGVGSAALLGAVARKAKNIIAVDINDEKLNIAKELGATHVINIRENVLDIIKKITMDKYLDFAVDCSGNIATMELAFKSINDKGTLVIAGNPKKGETISIVPFDLIKGKRIIGSWGGSTNPDKDIPLYIKQYLDGDLHVELLKTKIYSLEDINEAIVSFKKGDFSRVLLDCSTK
ncbi:zinc-binding dehydrogenase [Candidatus Woesearchaeota archaeon]|nr:zinc-binding dehydrogenase [Candidatus Woesearchaeota archaeon]MCF7900822.1 zinc-binding dehydrogenase [Candidatus Woesearchaeota archaeon]MCF8013124.1 zinc-binding dehydrogenase [Candidatus Woesearchaeota archaeon]